MAKVYFKKIDSYSKTPEISQSAKELIEKIQNQENVLDFTKPIPLKVHFGEEGCTTFIEPKNFEGIIEWLKANVQTNQIGHTTIFFTDTNVLYKGKRTTRQSHIALAEEHGFTKLPIIIADGSAGEEKIEVDISYSKTKHFERCAIGKTIAENPQMIVIAHFKGHMLSGFGGAIKQLAMGCAARAGKLAMHSQSRPVINPLQCKKCMICVENCPTNACIINTIPHIDTKKCIGCAKCIAVCPHGAVHVNWMSTGRTEFREKLAEYALAAQKGKKIIYINFAFNITKECDCVDKVQKLIARDIGVFASTDPVALDKACLQMLHKNTRKKMFSGEEIFEYSEKIGLGNTKYELIETK